MINDMPIIFNEKRASPLFHEKLLDLEMPI